MIVLIGASGFIGKHLLGEPRLAEDRLRCLARNPAAFPDVRPDVEVIEADMRDEAQLDRWFEPGAIVVNLAFDRTAPHSDNVAAARLLARMCSRAQVARLVHLRYRDSSRRQSRRAHRRSVPLHAGHTV